MDFRLVSLTDPAEKGVYVPGGRIWINLAPHSSLCDLIDTINHEAYHAAIARFYEDMDEDEEHLVIRQLELHVHDMV